MKFGNSGWDSVLGFVVLCLGFGMLEFGLLILRLWDWDLDLGILGLEFGSFGVRVWDSHIRFVVWCLRFGMLDFGILILRFWAWDL